MVDIVNRLIINTRKIFGKYTPKKFLIIFSHILHCWRDMKNRNLDVHSVFDEVYRNNQWGGDGGEMNSGHGTVEELYIPYCEILVDYIESKGSEYPIIVDIGCGDFNVGNYLLNTLSTPVHYIGVDAAPSLIRYHNNNSNIYKYDLAHKLEFKCLDATTDPLPQGDICLLRQVLQHLSNNQILSILNRIDEYSTIFITEEELHAEVNAKPNIDIIHGAKTRILFNSSLCLYMPPFSVSGLNEVLSMDTLEGTLLKTYMISKD